MLVAVGIRIYSYEKNVNDILAFFMHVKLVFMTLFLSEEKMLIRANLWITFNMLVIRGSMVVPLLLLAAENIMLSQTFQ